MEDLNVEAMTDWADYDRKRRKENAMDPDSLSPREKQAQLVELGLAGTMDEAAHMLVDAGDIDSSTHAELLSDAERRRIYEGERG